MSCVINQPEFRQSALGKRNVWCALVFSSNCFMARSARKIFQNKAIDGNYISTLGTDGMWTLSALCKKHPSIRQTHVIVACWGWARVWRRGSRGAHSGQMGSKETFVQAGSSVGGLPQHWVGLQGTLESALHVQHFKSHLVPHQEKPICSKFFLVGGTWPGSFSQLLAPPLRHSG